MFANMFLLHNRLPHRNVSSWWWIQSAASYLQMCSVSHVLCLTRWNYRWWQWCYFQEAASLLGGRGKSIRRKASYFWLYSCSGSRGLKKKSFYLCKNVCVKRRRGTLQTNIMLVWFGVSWLLWLEIAVNDHKDADLENSIYPNRCFSSSHFCHRTNRLQVTWLELK